MEPCTYFIIAAILFLTSFGALSSTAALATFAVAVITKLKKLTIATIITNYIQKQCQF